MVARSPLKSPKAAISRTTLFFILGNAIGALMFQRGCLVLLHASCVLIADRAIAIAGPSGAGKSTLSAALCQRGARLIADDLCALDTADSIQIMPGISGLKLWPDSLNETGLDASDAQPIRSGMSKRFLPAAGWYEARPHPLTSIYVVEAHTRRRTELQPLLGQTRFQTLERQVYRPRLARIALGPQRLFSALSSVVTRVPVTLVHRPTHGFHLDELCQTLMNEVGHAGAAALAQGELH